jgi:hypothetical protein
MAQVTTTLDVQLRGSSVMADGKQVTTLIEFVDKTAPAERQVRGRKFLRFSGGKCFLDNTSVSLDASSIQAVGSDLAAKVAALVNAAVANGTIKF